MVLARDAGPDTVNGIKVLSGPESSGTADDIKDNAPVQEDDTAVADRIYVYVCGEVRNPGVYALEAGARAYEALEAAGGMTEDALEGAVNLAALLTDAQKLCIPSVTESIQGMELPADTDGKIDINTATAAELTTLPGIGDKRAADIIAYRTGNGGFSSPDQLKQVNGIGEAVYAGLADMICVSGK